MADVEPMIVVCDKCGARLKLKPIQVKILNEVKCGKCGNRIPTANAVPASSAPPSVAAPLSEVMGQKSETPPPPEPESEPVAPAAPPPVGILEPPPEPKAVTPPPSAPPPSAPVVAPLAPVFTTSQTPQPPKERTQTIKSRTASFGPAPVPGGDSPAALKAKIADLESEVKIFRQQIIALEGQLAHGTEERTRFQELLQRTADAEDRAAEMQAVVNKKERECRAIEEKMERMAHERDEANAVRDTVLNNIKDLLATYHSTEYDAARKRLADLDDRIDRFVSLMRQRNNPAAPQPPEPIAEARDINS